MNEEIIILEDEIEEIEEIEILEVSELAGVAVRHSTLPDKDDPEQHLITSITGLKEKLDSLESLKTVYSDTKGQADYYRWWDGNSSGENRDGLFVTMYENNDGMNVIKVCDGNDDVFGVTVSGSAFVGGQAYTANDNGTKNGRDASYGLVAYSGLAAVRRQTDVIAGDYVVPAANGYAKKVENGKYGYLVTTLRENETTGELYADISLSSPSTFAKAISDVVFGSDTEIGLVARVGVVESKVDSATIVANDALLLAQSAYDEIEKSSETAGSASNKVDQIQTDVNQKLESIDKTLDEALAKVATAEAAATSAAQSADSIKTEAVQKANDAIAGINDLINDLEPISQWSAIGEDGTTREAVQYLVDYIDDELVTRADVVAGETINAEYKNIIERSASQTNSLIAKIAKYSVGSYSQAYGLTYDQAKSTLTTLMTYIPTMATATEAYGKSDGTIYTQEFHKGYYYTWIGDYTSIRQWDDADKDTLTTYYDRDTGYFWHYMNGRWYHRDTSKLANLEPYSWVESLSTAVSFASNYQYGAEGNYWVVANNDVVLEVVESWDEEGKDKNKEYYDMSGKQHYLYSKAEDKWMSITPAYEFTNVETLTYDFNGLYLFTGGEWVKVASVADEDISRVISGIYQNANEISMEVTDLRGSVSGLVEEITNTESRVQTLAYHAIGDYVALEVWNDAKAEPGTIYFVANRNSDDDAQKNLYYYYKGGQWKSTKLAYEAGLDGTLATIQQQADDNGASIALVIKDGAVDAESIASAITMDEQSISMLANKIAVDGTVTFTHLAEQNDKTIINGGNITTGAIQSDNYVDGFSGTMIDLDNGAIIMNNGGVIRGGCERHETKRTEEFDETIEYSYESASVKDEDIYHKVWSWRDMEYGCIYKIPSESPVSIIVKYGSIDESSGDFIPYIDYIEDIWGTIINYYRCNMLPDHMFVSDNNIFHIYFAEEEMGAYLCYKDDSNKIIKCTLGDFWYSRYQNNYGNIQFRGYISSAEEVGKEYGYYILVPDDFKEQQIYGYQYSYSVDFNIVINNTTTINSANVNLVDAKASFTYVGNTIEYDCFISDRKNGNTIYCTMYLNYCDSLIVDRASGGYDEYIPRDIVFSVQATGTKEVIDVTYTNGAIIDFGDEPYIEFPKFKVDHDGHINATSVTIGDTTITDGDGKLQIPAANISGELTAAIIKVSGDDNQVVFEADMSKQRVTMSSACITGEIIANTIQSENYQDNYSVIESDDSAIYGTFSFIDKGSFGYWIQGDGTNKESVTDIVIPKEYNGQLVTGINTEAFRSYTALKRVIIPDSVTHIGQRAFQGCSNLSKINIPFGVKTIDNNAFTNCSSLISVSLPHSLVFIGSSAFKYCGLDNIIIPDSITNLGAGSLACLKLKSVIIPKSVNYIGANLFGDTPRSSEEHADKITVYCEHVAQPDRWDQSWSTTTSNRPVTVYWYENGEDGNRWSYNDSGFKISSDDKYMINSKYFKVTQDGIINASNVNISGCISSNTLTSTFVNDSGATTGKGSINSVDGGFEIDCSIGTGNLKGTWKLNSSENITSDKNQKHDIQLQANVYSDVFDKLRPVTFKYNDGLSDRTHTGFIAQEVEEAVLDSGLTTKDFAAVCYDVDENGNKINYGIRYDEIISMCVAEIQKLKKRVEELENNTK